MMQNILTDVATLTALPQKTLEKLSRKAMYSICDAIYEHKLSNNTDILELDIGIGILLVKVDDTEPKYRFKPNDVFAKYIRKMFENIDDYQPFASKIAIEDLNRKFDQIYKDLC